MNHNWKRATACFMVLALVAVLCLGCGDHERKEQVTIVIGESIDLTGPASPAEIPVREVIEDIVRYYNEESLIPGAKIKVATYDNQFNPGRDLPGYEWCKNQGAKVIIGVHDLTAETLKPFAERDKVPVATVSYTDFAATPPGWVFIFSSHTTYQICTLLKWISEERWDYSKGLPKIGFYGWREAMNIHMEKTMREYCQAHPDKFEWVGGFMTPVGTTSCAGEIKKLKDCDYICPWFMAGAFFMRDFRARGYAATFISDSGNVGYYEFYIDLCGWEVLDGVLTTNIVPWWNEQSPAVDLIKQVVNRYHPGQARMRASYEGAFHLIYSFFEVLRQAVKEVGAEGFNGQAFYNAAVKFKVKWEGLPEWGFSDTKRYLIDNVAVHEWRANVEDMVRVSDWLPLVKE